MGDSPVGWHGSSCFNTGEYESTSKQKATYKLCFDSKLLCNSNSGISAGAAIHRLLMAEITLFTIFLKAVMF